MRLLRPTYVEVDLDIIKHNINEIKKVIDKNINDNFVKLQESGRKISLIIPSEDRAKYYALVTRSYITFDEKTGQAGIGYYRYLDIRPQVK